MGRSRLTFWTNASDRPDLESELRRRGAEHYDTVSVLARPVDEIDIVVPEGVTSEVVRTREQIREMDAVNGYRLDIA